MSSPRRPLKASLVFIPPGIVHHAVLMETIVERGVLGPAIIGRAAMAGELREFLGYRKGCTDSTAETIYLSLEDLVTCWPHLTGTFLGLRVAPKFISWLRTNATTEESLVRDVNEMFESKFYARNPLDVEPMKALRLVKLAEVRWKMRVRATHVDIDGTSPGSIQHSVSRSSLESVGISVSTVRWKERKGFLESWYVSVTHPEVISDQQVHVSAPQAMELWPDKASEIQGVSEWRYVLAPTRGRYSKVPGAMFGVLTGQPMLYSTALDHRELLRQTAFETVANRDLGKYSQPSKEFTQ